MNAVISGWFPDLAARSGAIPFALFASVMLLQFVVVLMPFPETRA